MYVTYDKYDQKKLAEQISACFNLGVVGERIPQHILDSRTKCVKDLYAMEQTKVIFMDLGEHRNIHKQLDARIKEHRIWLKHWDKCFAEHKRGADKKATSTQGFSLTFIASCMVAEETADSVKAVKKPELKATKKPEQRDKPAAMVTKQQAPEPKKPEQPKQDRKAIFLQPAKKKDKPVKKEDETDGEDK